MKDVNILIQGGVDVNKSLELFGDMATYDDTLNLFLSEIDDKLSKLHQYKEIADLANYAIIAHSLKSEVRYLGFTDLGELCYKHELEGKANNLFFINDDYDHLISSIKDAVNLAKLYFGEEIEIEQPVVINDDKKILIVDDSNVISNFVGKIVDDEYGVVIAHDGSEALEKVNSDDEIIAMLLDLNMPNVNGFAVLEYFKQHDLFKKIPVSIITGLGNEDLIEQAFKYPIIDVLRKPFNERDLKEVLNKTINNLK